MNFNQKKDVSQRYPFKVPVEFQEYWDKLWDEIWDNIQFPITAVDITGKISDINYEFQTTKTVPGQGTIAGNFFINVNVPINFG